MLECHGEQSKPQGKGNVGATANDKTDQKKKEPEATERSQENKTLRGHAYRKYVHIASQCRDRYNKRRMEANGRSAMLKPWSQHQS